MTNLDVPPQEVLDLIQACIEEYHPELSSAGVTVDAMFAFNDKTYPVKSGGYPAMAAIKINSVRNRKKGLKDAEITFDGEVYKSLSPEQAKALVDQQLFYLEIKKNKEGEIKRDDADRVVLKLKKVDYRLSWFREIALRHGQNSPEVYQAKLLWNNDGKTFFPAAE